MEVRLEWQTRLVVLQKSGLQKGGRGEFSSDLYRALVCDIIIRKCII